MVPINDWLHERNLPPMRTGEGATHLSREAFTYVMVMFTLRPQMVPPELVALVANRSQAVAEA